MSVIYQPGQELTSTDLRIYLRNRAGDLTNVYEMLYSLYYYDPVLKEYTVVSGSYQQTAEEGLTTGLYWVPWDVPRGANCGAYLVKWTFKTSADAPYQQASTKFSIAKINVGSYRAAQVSDLSGEPFVIVT